MSQKFTQPLAEVPISVAFELNFGATNSSDAFKEYCSYLQETSAHLIHQKGNETVTRIYVPPKKSVLKDGGTFLVFPKSIPKVEDKVLFFRLMFKRDHPLPWMAVARNGEQKCFGFSMDTVRNKGRELDLKHYLPLAYPGKSEKFVPTFVKFMNSVGGFSYLQIGAGDRGADVVVGVKVVDEKDVNIPQHLLSAMPQAAHKVA